MSIETIRFKWYETVWGRTLILFAFSSILVLRMTWCASWIWKLSGEGLLLLFAYIMVAVDDAGMRAICAEADAKFGAELHAAQMRAARAKAEELNSTTKKTD